MAEKEPSANQLKELARGIVLSQGNVFIKELLREKGLRIGSTKADFTANLNEAIDAGDLTAADIEAWLHRVEGWGNEYVYLYDLSEEAATHEYWSNPDAVQARVHEAGFADLWNASSSLAFPDEPSLTGIYFGDRVFRLTWHQGIRSMARDTSKDYEEVIEDDLYQFRAFRQRSERTVMRFDVRLDSRVAAAFIQVPVSSDEHGDARTQMMEVVNQFIPQSGLIPFDVAEAMKKLDQQQLAGGDQIKTHQARWSGQGAYVEFGANSRDHGYREADPIRELRQALVPGSVVGNRATMIFQTPAEEGPAREVRVHLYGSERRMWLRAQMTEGQVWALLDRIRA